MTFPPFLKFERAASYASPTSSLYKRLNKSFFIDTYLCYSFQKMSPQTQSLWCHIFSLHRHLWDLFQDSEETSLLNCSDPSKRQEDACQLREKVFMSWISEDSSSAFLWNNCIPSERKKVLGGSLYIASPSLL